MNAVRVSATIPTDGELHLTRLPFRRGEQVEAIVLKVDTAPSSTTDAERAAALDAYLALARVSSFRSTGSYPSRSELHERA